MAKINNAALFNMIWGLLVKRGLLRKKKASYLGGWDADSPPTQADKPSPSSSLEREELRASLDLAFPVSKGYTILEVLDTNSMEPLIDDNCLVVLEGKLRKYRPGQVVVYKGDYSPFPSLHGKFVMHEIIKVDRKKGLLLKGRNNIIPDGWIPTRAVLHNLVAIGYFEQTESGD